MDGQKVKVLHAWSTPKNVKHVRPAICRFAHLAKPLHALVGKGIKRDSLNLSLGLWNAKPHWMN